MLKFQKLVMNIVTAPPTEIAHSTELLKRKKKISYNRMLHWLLQNKCEDRSIAKDTAII